MKTRLFPWIALCASAFLIGFLSACGDTILEPVVIPPDPVADVSPFDGNWEGAFVDAPGALWFVELQFDGDNVTGGLMQHLLNSPPRAGSDCGHQCDWFPFLVIAKTIGPDQWSITANVSGTWSMEGRLHPTEADAMQVIVKHLQDKPDPFGSGTYTLYRAGFGKR